MRLKSHYQKKILSGRQRAENREQRTEQSKSGAIRTVCAVGNATSVASKQRAMLLELFV